MNRLLALTLILGMLFASIAGGVASFSHAIEMNGAAVAGTDHLQTNCTEHNCAPNAMTTGCEMVAGHCTTALIRPVSSPAPMAIASIVRFPPDPSASRYGSLADMDLPPPRA